MNDILITSISAFALGAMVVIAFRVLRFEHQTMKALRFQLDLIRRDMRKLHQKQTEAKRELQKFVGQNAQSILKGKIAERYAMQAHDKANEALGRVIGIEKSTHRVQLMPMEQVLAKNTQANDLLKKVLNPGDEDYDWDLPFSDADDNEEFMPNRRLRRGA